MRRSRPFPVHVLRVGVRLLAGGSERGLGRVEEGRIAGKGGREVVRRGGSGRSSASARHPWRRRERRERKGKRWGVVGVKKEKEELEVSRQFEGGGSKERGEETGGGRPSLRRFLLQLC